MTGQTTRDQRRAQRAYQHIAKVKQLGEVQQREYRTLVLGLGPLVLRSGLVTALAFLQRRTNEEAEDRNPAGLLLKHLVESDIPGLRPEGGEEPDHTSDQICQRSRTLDLEETMLATRELIKVVEWLKRAAEATLPSGRG